MYTINTNNEKETLDLAEKLGNLVQARDVILLEGDLGAGKTTFTKGLATGMGIGQVIKSPTYTIIREYTKGRLPLYHMDVYRLEEAGSDEMGLEEYFYGDGVSVVEWSKFIADELPNNYLLVQIDKTGEYLQNRTFTIESVGERYDKLLIDWKNLNEN
ncbi:tRNA (adenosine(37)-N6)-threonylcarbamoyltransferase complex ATPase subunit type 1 TsaE [Jeotgalibaca sp. A127]|uniref:tRNA (adenosine(37)-N6)-threonylcarbamoyltransferase complex ATPase subunit type 1 TsaE n=1 Tax=Jeotgalibaca sp. A127 TaxID=3457324 RepID=UPI003FD48ECB